METETFVTPDFFFLVPDEAAPPELWLDWIPKVDEDPFLPISAQREGKDLIITVQSASPRPPRRLVALEPRTWDALDHGFTLVLAAASKVLSKRAVLFIPRAQ